MSCAQSFVLDHSALQEDDVVRAGAIPHTPAMMAEGHTVGLRAVREFINWCVMPPLNGLINPTQKELALKPLFGRIRLLIETLLVLTTVKHFQSIVGASRTSIELYIDMCARHAIVVQSSFVPFANFAPSCLKTSGEMLDVVAAT